MGANSHIIDLSKLDKLDLDIVGKKAVELGELTRLRIPIPDGFVIAPFLHLSESLIREIHSAYRKLSGVFKETSLNIFTSPLKGKSLQFSNVKGDTNLILKIKEIWALQLHEPLAIIVQKNIMSKIKGKIITNAPLIDKKFVALAYKIQKHFYFPKVVDYVIEKNKIYVTWVNPFTGSVEKLTKIKPLVGKKQKVLIKGISINPGIVTGPVKILGNNSHAQIKNGEVIILPHLNKPLYEKIKKAKAALSVAKAIVIDTVLISSYDRMIYRKDFKMPTVEGTKNAAKILQNGNIITVNGASGEIYRGSLI